MYDWKKLLDLSESYTIYVILGAFAVIAGATLANLGNFFAPSAMQALGGLLRSPGRALFVAGFLAAGIAGNVLPNSLRITCIAVGVVLFLRFLASPELSRLL